MKTTLAVALAGLTLSFAPAIAGPSTIWAVDASATGSGVSNPAYAEQFSLTGALLKRVSLGSGFNPTGIAVVGNTGYVSADADGVLRTFNLGTGALGATYATGQNALGALTSDGSSVWASDFTGGNKAYRFSLTGQLLGTTTLGNCGSYCNGFEYEAGALVANRGQNVGPYDRYSTGGTLLTPNVFTAGDGGALAFNSDSQMQLAAVSGGQGGVQTSPGGLTIAFGGSIPDTGFATTDRFINDLAFQVPEPTTLALLVTGLGMLGLRRRRAA
ncbi:MAG: hypothetical protein NVSMB18_36320 [Acetobacteraceae bacterium]